ncbi:hypothetical protein P9X10_02870 [Bacillus cereus]|nr:hypothetical protein [Bacillus cereus]
MCKLFGCRKTKYAKGYCVSHYEQYRNGREVGEVKEYRMVCSIEDCIGKHHAKGYCRNHYNQFKKHGKILPKKDKTCNVEGCNDRSRTRGMCIKHYTKWYREEKKKEK